MRALRVILALLLATGSSQAQPVVELLTRYSVPIDETAAAAPEGDAPQGSGKKLAELEANLSIVSESLEAFAHPQDAAKALRAAKPRLPADTPRYFRDRATALDSLYRTLAVVDYTWAIRFPDPPCSPAEKRGELLRSDDGLFVDRASGQTSAWMTALLGPSAKGKALDAALDRASASAAPSQAEYARLRARQNLITKALGSEGAIGAARAGLYCKRAETRVRLAAANRTSNQVLAARSSEEKPSRQGVVIVAGKTFEGLEARGAGVVVDTKSGIRILTDRRLGNGEVVALVDGKTTPVPLTVEREDAPSGLLLLRPAGDIGEALRLAEAAPKKDDLVYAFAHSEHLGAWTRTQGLVTSVGSNQFQSDAIVDASMTGGAVLDEEGRLVGLLVLRPTATGEWPAAVPAPALHSWIEGGIAPEAEAGPALDVGTTKILTASRPLLDSLSVGEGAIVARAADIYTPTPWGTVRGVCMANCEDSAPAASYSEGSNGNRELGEALGKLAAVGLEALIFKGIPALFRGIGNLFKGKGNTSHVAQTPLAPKPVQSLLPPKPKEPPKISGLELTLTPDELLDGESLEAVATLRFSGDDPKKEGIVVSFEYGGKTHTAATGSNGVAVFIIPVEPSEARLRERPFDSLKDEELRARGEEIPSYLRPERNKQTAVEKIDRRSPAAFAALDNEERTLRDLEGGDTDAGEAGEVDAVAVDWVDDEEGGVRAGASFSAAPMTLPDAIPLEKLYDLPVRARASAGSMGSASDSKQATVMSNRCPPGTIAPNEDPPNASPGQPPAAPPDKATLDAVCREYEQVADETCASTSTKACKDTVLMLLEYDFRSCLDRWKPDGSGSVGGIGSPVPPKPRRMPPSRRCVRIVRAQTGSIAGTTSHMRSLGKGTQRPMGDAGRASWRSLIKRLLAGARFLKNVTHAIFEVKGGLTKLTELFDAVTQGRSVEKRPDGIKTARMPDGTTIALRPSSSGGPPTIQISGAGGQKIKIRAP